MTAALRYITFFFAYIAALMIVNSMPTSANLHDSQISGRLTAYEESDYENVYEDYLKHKDIFNSYIGNFHQIGCIDYKDLRESVKTTPVIRELSDNLIRGLESELEIAYKLHGFVYLDINYDETGDDFNAERILREKKGDCAEKSVLLASLLDAGGINSYVADGHGHRYVFARINGSWMPLDATRDFYFAYRVWINDSSSAKHYYEGSNFQPFLFNKTATVFNEDWCA